jgi:Short C-terminal domain
MFMRRRPLLRAAVVGGGTYLAGKRNAQRSAEQAQREAYQDTRIGDLEGSRGARATSPVVPPARAAPRSATARPAQQSVTEQLAQLNRLHEQGALTDAEFVAAKSQLIGS